MESFSGPSLRRLSEAVLRSFGDLNRAHQIAAQAGKQAARSPFWGHCGVQNELKTVIKVKTVMFQINCKSQYDFDLLKVEWNSFQGQN